MDAGIDLSWFRPVPQERLEEYRDGQTLGSYREQSEGLNVRNAQRGFTYCWVNTLDPHGITRRQIEGWEFVTKDQPEGQLGYQQFHISKGTSTDNYVHYGNLVLARIQIEKHAALRQRKREQIRERIMGPTHEFHTSGHNRHAQLAATNPKYASRRGHTYYEREDHEIEIKEYEPTS